MSLYSRTQCITKLWQEFRFSSLENELMKLLKWYFAILIKMEYKIFGEEYIARYIAFAIDTYIYIHLLQIITSRNLRGLNIRTRNHTYVIYEQTTIRIEWIMRNWSHDFQVEHQRSTNIDNFILYYIYLNNNKRLFRIK